MPCTDAPSGASALDLAFRPENRISTYNGCFARGGVCSSLGRELHATGVPVWVTFPYQARLREAQPEVPARVLRCEELGADRLDFSPGDSIRKRGTFRFQRKSCAARSRASRESSAFGCRSPSCASGGGSVVGGSHVARCFAARNAFSQSARILHRRGVEDHLGRCFFSVLAGLRGVSREGRSRRSGG